MSDPAGIPEPSSSGAFAATEADVVCPFCGETVTIALDPGGGAAQEYVQDCEVCCRPWELIVRYAADGTVTIDIRQSS